MSDTEEVPVTREERNRWLWDCSRCFGKFPTKKALDAHLNRRLFKCPFRCKQTFVHKDELKCHEKVCSNRLKTSSFDCYKIYNMINIRHRLAPRRPLKCLFGTDLWIKYPYWYDNTYIDKLGLPVPSDRLIYEDFDIQNKIIKQNFLKTNAIKVY